MSFRRGGALMGRVPGGAAAPPIPPERRGRTIRRIAAFFRPYLGAVAIVLGAILLTSLLGLINPILLKLLIDDVIVGHDYGRLNLYVGLMILLPIISGLIGVGQSYLNNVIGQRVMQDLRLALYGHLQRMPLRWFTVTRTGEIQSRLANDVGGVQAVVTDTASTVLSNVVTIISTIIAMLVLSVPLTILSLLLMPLFLWLTVRVGKARREVAGHTQRTLADLTAVTEETLSVSGMLLSKSFGRQAYEVERYRGENVRLTDLLIRQTMIGRSFFALIGFFFSITPALVYLVAGWVNTGHPPADFPIQSGILV